MASKSFFCETQASVISRYSLNFDAQLEHTFSCVVKHLRVTLSRKRTRTSNMSLPTTITSDNIQAALTQSLKKHITIKELQVQQNDAGGNYCSDIYRITVKFTVDNNEEQTQELKLLIKDLYASLAKTSKESFMYQTVLPEMNAILGTIQDGGRFSPRVYLTQRDGREQYLFEDLNASGYIQCDHFLGFNEAQTKCVLEKLGQFHATSMIYQEKQPEIVAGMNRSGYRSYMDFCDKMVTDNVAYVSKIVEKWPQFAAIAAKLRNNTGETFQRRFLSCLERHDCQVKVIIHGDLWIKNILLLEHAEQQPTDAVFVDYQVCSLGSPGLDFNNFLLTSVQLQVYNSADKRNALIKHYYESFKQTLLRLGYASAHEVPTLQMLTTEMDQSEYYSYYALMFSFPQTVLREDLAKDMNFEAFFDDDRTAVNRKDMFSNERVLDTLKYMLPRLDKMGVLD